MLSRKYKQVGFPNYSNPLTIDMIMLRKGELREGLIRTYPIGKVVEYMRDYFNGVDGYQVDIVYGEGVKCIRVITPNNNELINETVKILCNLCGFSLAHRMGNDEIIELTFEPKFQDEFEQEINSEHFLMHISPYFNREKIMKYGLAPKTKNTLFTYDSKIHLLKGSYGIENAIRLAKSLNNVKMKNNQYIEDTYDFYLLAMHKIPNNVKFQRDPFAKGGVTTTDNIPSNAIDSVRRVNLRFYENK